MGYEAGETYAFTYQGVQEKGPNASGVYMIYTSQEWVYVGEGEDIQKSLFQHLNEPSACMDRFGPLSFSFELVPAAERTSRQQALVAELEPACNPAKV
jgi:predicted GIY-YIG superfamily endonuclease